MQSITIDFIKAGSGAGGAAGVSGSPLLKMFQNSIDTMNSLHSAKRPDQILIEKVANFTGALLQEIFSDKCGVEYQCMAIPSWASPSGGLKLLHSEKLLKSTSSYKYWSQMSTREIIESLKPGLRESLKIKSNGVIMNGNTRSLILQERKFDLLKLPFDLY